MSRTRRWDVAAACAEWLAVAGLVAGAAVVLTATSSPAGAASGRTDQRAGLDRAEAADPSDDPAPSAGEHDAAGGRARPGTEPVWARNGFVPGTRGVVLARSAGRCCCPTSRSPRVRPTG